jgi:hypothetical protein
MNTFDDDERKNDDEMMGGFEKAYKTSMKDSANTTQATAKVADSSKVNSSRCVLDIEEDNVLFKDFTEPDLMKTGYLIPLNCGHNGQFSVNEKTIYEIHLTNAGFIQETAPQSSSDYVDSYNE